MGVAFAWHLNDPVAFCNGALSRLVRIEGDEAKRPPPPSRALFREVYVFDLRQMEAVQWSAWHG